MQVWLIGGGIYALALLFAFALCRVASPTTEGDIESSACDAEPPNDGNEYEQLVDHDGYHVDGTVRSEPDDQSLEVPVPGQA